MKPCAATYVKNSHAFFGQEQSESKKPQASIDWFEKLVIPSCNRAIGIFFHGASSFKRIAVVNANEAG